MIHGKLRIVLNFTDCDAYYLQWSLDYFFFLMSSLSHESLFFFLISLTLDIQELPILMKLLSVCVGNPFSALSCTEALICFE